MKSKNKTIIMNLVGGLGNQLFIYFAGQALAKALNCKVVYHQTKITRSFNQINSDISVFDFKLDEYTSMNKTLWVRIRSWFPSILKNAIKKVFSYSISNSSSLGTIIINTYDEKKLDPSAEIAEIKKALTKKSKLFVSGYFQNFLYYDLFNENRNLTIRHPSSWYQATETKVIERAPIIVHIRLGDYLQYRGSIGVLSRSYWDTAIEKVSKKFPDREVWVFSDDFKLARLLTSHLGGMNLIYMQDSEGGDPGEIMKIISLGEVLVLSNSTFSAWSAKFSGLAQEVYVPDPFFESLPNGKLISCDHWIRIPSQFMKHEEIEFFTKIGKS
jgi:hypothetical protein